MIFIYYITDTFRGVPTALSRSRDHFRDIFFTLLRLSLAIPRLSLSHFIFFSHVNKFLLQTQTDNFIGA